MRLLGPLIACAACACSFPKNGLSTDDASLADAVVADGVADEGRAPDGAPDAATGDGVVTSETDGAESGVDASLDGATWDGAADGGDAADDGGTDAGDDGGGDGGDGGKCTIPKAPLEPCTSIPRYEPLAFGQVLDGASSDFCDLPVVDYDGAMGPGAAKVKVRVAWSSFGLHAHLAVREDKTALPYDGTDGKLYLGDSVEVYVAGTDLLTGAFDGAGKDPGAQQLIISRPEGALDSQGSVFFMQAFKAPLAKDRFAGRIGAGGVYEIEVRLPWSDLAATGVSAGKKIALTFALNNKFEVAKPQAFKVFETKPWTGTTSCVGPMQPSCDDRLWCTPTLAP